MRATAQSEDRRDAPIFIVGCGRSGTTLLRLMLNRHPRIAIPGETWYFPDLDAIRERVDSEPEPAWRGSVASFIERAATFPELGVSRDAIDAELATLGRNEWGKVLAAANLAFARAESKPRWGDKTPGYVRCLPLIKREYPGAFVLHMIRDARDVAASFFEQPFGPKTALEAARYWKADVTRGQTDGPALFGDRYVEIRYEELSADPGGALQDLCNRLDEEFDSRMLDQGRNAERYVLAQHRWHSQATKAVTTQRIGRWRKSLSARDVQLIELEVGALLNALGYWPESRQTLSSLGAWSADRATRTYRHVLTRTKRFVYLALRSAGILT